MNEKSLEKLEFNEVLKDIEKYAKTYLGKNRVLDLKPSFNKEKIERGLNQTSEGCDLIHNMGDFPIYELDDTSLIIKKIEGNVTLSIKEILQIKSILENAKELKKYYKDSKLTLENLQDYFENLYVNESLIKEISKDIISETEISDNASAKLKQIREKRKEAEGSIKDNLNHIIHSKTYSKFLQDSPSVTIRNDRYVIPVKEEYRNEVKGFIHDVSSKGSTVYIEPISVFEINNKISELYLEEEREIQRILQELSEGIFKISGFIKQNISIIGNLDFIFAKSKYSIEFDCSKPIIDNYIDLKVARHPLINKEKAVPINVNLGKNFNTLVITRA